ncbi:U32 family peptidase [Candidatus Woesearchaeota archaeon]|nr:U32 family peptidase [Candidatus Woesearchaeota archaeon]
MAIEIMAPCGSWESLMAAIKAGAGSVYFGIEKLNMRARAARNFKLSDLKKISKLCRSHNVKTYLALNIVLYDDELKEMRKICDSAKKAGISAVIASDIAAIEYAHSISQEVHISTQANVSNFEAVKFYSKYADVVVLARELSLSQIKKIIEKVREEKIQGPNGILKIELFVHGALCVSIAGKCYMSLAAYNHSANRGDCLQTCRRKYRVFDDETGHELVIDNNYVMSPKDLCTINCLDKILDAGVEVLKIEGRGRSPEYVYATVKAYREAADSWESGKYTQEKVKKWIKELESVFNRGFWKGGYYLGNKLGEWSAAYGSKATKKKTYLGKIQNYYSKKKVASLFIESGSVKEKDEMLITGPTTGVVSFTVDEMLKENSRIITARQGDLVSFKVPEKVRKNDKAYVVRKKPRLIRIR